MTCAALFGCTGQLVDDPLSNNELYAKGGKNAELAMLSVTPDPAVAFVDTYTVSGCGLEPATITDIEIRGPYDDLLFSRSTDANGCISFEQLANRAGDYVVDAFQVTNGNKAWHVATGSFVVIDATAPDPEPRRRTPEV